MRITTFRVLGEKRKDLRNMQFVNILLVLVSVAI